jgi:hypothetical protein
MHSVYVGYPKWHNIEEVFEWFDDPENRIALTRIPKMPYLPILGQACPMIFRLSNILLTFLNIYYGLQPVVSAESNT